MPLFRARSIVEQAQKTQAEIRSAWSGSFPLASTRPLTIPAWPMATSLDQAMRVPAFRRGIDLIAGTISTFPLVEHPLDGVAPIPARPLVRQPEPDRPYSATMKSTITDLVSYGVAYWVVLTRSPASEGSWPRRVRYVPADQVQAVDDSGPLRYNIAGTEHPGLDVIRFDAGRGVLLDAADTIGLAVDLENAAARYARTPLPSFAIRNTGADLPAEQVDELLDAWELARQSRTTAYLNSTLDTVQFGWNADELQLVDARNQAALEIARSLNLDPAWVGASIPGQSITYQNRVDLYRQLLDTTMTPLMNVIAQRLSFSRPRLAPDSPAYPAVSEANRRIAFDTDRFLQANYNDRVQTAIALHAAGLVTTEEARSLLDITPLGGPAV